MFCQGTSRDWWPAGSELEKHWGKKGPVIRGAHKGTKSKGENNVKRKCEVMPKDVFW
ncbi:hypothetical protein SLEP1_g3580 [Rubroshorea leprosula]|uniref:Uncharacterized protein n=1 Tax=Rubroshorea leprosula TaxID=152421 RepID=A0AAV5HRL7_9ROSI|nr:hypothetical protein SLEP1_g3580 [Rubroshorea leprosula]